MTLRIMKKLLFGIAVLASFPALSQNISKIEPPSWWAGMKHDTVEFMVYGEDISELQAQSTTLNVISSEGLTSKNYLFVTAVVPEDVKIGTHHFTFTNTKGKRVAKANVEILQRKAGSAE